MNDKQRFLLYVIIAKKAEDMGIYNGERHTLLMDLESADKTFNLKLQDLIKADDVDFAHDVIGIVNNINRNQFPATDFNLFVPRFAGNN